MSDVPPSLVKLRSAWADDGIMPLTLSHMDRIYPTRTVPHAGEPWIIPRNDRQLDFDYEFEGKTYRAEDALDRTYTNALLIIKNGKIIYEKYRNNSEEHDRFAGFSMSKSVTSLLVGCALEQGRIGSLDDPIDKYLPELDGSGYQGVSIRQLLQMRSGVAHDEDYSDLRAIPPASPRFAMMDNVMRYVDDALVVERVRDPGSKFQYLNLDTGVLGWLIERVSGGYNISAYTTVCLWEPLGAESDAFFVMDGPAGVGREFNAAGFNATVRDWARIGLMMLNNGQAKRRVVSEQWVKESTTPLPTGRPGRPGYGYQWWTVKDSPAFQASGRFGQRVFVDPATETVVIKASHFPVSEFDAAGRETDAFLAAVSRWRPR
ncbi:serine hydrolase domain-containing protein [Kineobactrum salinum]|uniref:Serine hydrolase n=1 Tax=Kineobactrum salinum TaxID=2708301 RepID=A0A6C0UBF7_9GAMM|nr:serine hydrolase [Kineobactrum salinum]QIB67394.1 serine hydrolase [Kineobactrum salinum]